MVQREEIEIKRILMEIEKGCEIREARRNGPIYGPIKSLPNDI